MTKSIEHPSILIAPDGTLKPVRPQGKSWTLAELYKLIGTDMIEVVYATKDPAYILIIDEEGKLKADAEVNLPATTRTTLYPHDVIVGKAVYTPSDLLQ